MELPVWCTVGMLAGVVFFFTGFGRWRRLRLIEDTPTAKVRSMPMGRVELQGRALGKAELAAPLTGSPCVYYRYRVEQEVSTGKRRSWKTLAKGDSSAWPFHLEDDTGRVLIDPADAHVELEADWREVNPAIEGVLAGFLAEHGIEPRGWVFTKKLRFTEWRIAPGDPVFALGVAQERPGLAAERRQRVHDKLAALRSDPEAMSHLDRDGDGRVDADEWELARRLIVEEIGREAVDDRVVLGADPGGSAPFYLSDRHQDALLAHHRWRAVGGVFGGAALALGSGAVLLHHFGRL